MRDLGGSLRGSGGGEGGAKVASENDNGLSHLASQQFTALVQPLTNCRSDAVDNPFGAPDFMTLAALVSSIAAISRPNSINCCSAGLGLGAQHVLPGSAREHGFA